MASADEYILIDSNILLRNEQTDHVQHAVTVQALKILRDQGKVICIVPQNLYEFWNVCTRPLDRNGLGRSVEETQQDVSKCLRLYPLLRDEPDLFEKWLEVVSVHGVRGAQVHDARLAAAMLLHEVPTLLTHNADDFQRYHGIRVITPSEVVASPQT